MGVLDRILRRRPGLFALLLLALATANTYAAYLHWEHPLRVVLDGSFALLCIGAFVVCVWAWQDRRRR